MVIKDIFDVGEIMESEEKAKEITPLNDDNCVIVGKALNKNKIILNMKRVEDESTGNVFVKVTDGNKEYFQTSKKLLASKNVLGLTLKQFKEFDVEKL
jgi:hypothetical protein